MSFTKRSVPFAQGQLGHGEDGRMEDVKPRRIAQLPPGEYVQIAVGAMHSAVLTKEGRVRLLSLQLRSNTLS